MDTKNTDQNESTKGAGLGNAYTNSNKARGIKTDRVKNKTVSILGNIRLEEEEDILAFLQNKYQDNFEKLEDFLSNEIYDTVSRKISEYHEQSIKSNINSLKSCLGKLKDCGDEELLPLVKTNSELRGWTHGINELENEIKKVSNQNEAFLGLLFNFQDILKYKNEEGVALSPSEKHLKELVSIY